MSLPSVNTRKRDAQFTKSMADRRRHAASLDHRTSEWSMSALFATLSCLAACVSAPDAPHSAAPATEQPLQIASWNLEFLSEQDGAGCPPRTPSDYAAMKRIVDGLDADVIAFQEAESIGAAERIFDPSRFTIIMENRAGQPSRTCGGGIRTSV